VFIDAGPGTGKTTVAAQRFGALRFAPEARTDHRAVTAVSFTRAATWTLQRRVKRIWGSGALTWPHRITTLDTIMIDLLHNLLRTGLLRWPNAHTELTVVDSWNSVGKTDWIRVTYELSVESGNVKFTKILRDPASRVPLAVIGKRLSEGVCTHQDVRDALAGALEDSVIADRLRERLAETTRALIVDEVFDANDLDITVIELAAQAGLSITLVGDPWQALYVFRGARPEAIPELLARTAIHTLPLTKSFRWRDPAQRRLAGELRAGHGVALDVVAQDIVQDGVDVVLATEWKKLWTASNRILPLAFHAFRGGMEEAAATLLLDHVTRTVLGESAVYLGDSLTALAINDPEVPKQLESGLQRVVEILVSSDNGSLNAAYRELADVLKTISPYPLRDAHHSHTGRLARIAARLAHSDRPVLGLTTHQAKGREWDTVGLVLSDSEYDRLRGGLVHTEDTDRKLYVACTRARRRTVLMDS
jgi:DNA helicase-2/ATP-dependent DNA helicase PcrA